MGEIWGVLAAVLSSALGGTSIGATRFLVGTIDPLAIGAFRFGIGVVLLLPLALLQRGSWPPSRDWPGVAGLGLLFFAAFPVLFNASLIFTTAARGALALSAPSRSPHARPRASWSRSSASRWPCSLGSPRHHRAPGVAIS